MYLENLTAVGIPGVAEAPCAVAMAVEYADLAVDGAGCAAVAVRVECDGLYEVLVAVLEIKVEGGLLVAGRGGDRGRHVRTGKSGATLGLGGGSLQRAEGRLMLKLVARSAPGPKVGPKVRMVVTYYPRVVSTYGYLRYVPL